MDRGNLWRFHQVKRLATRLGGYQRVDGVSPLNGEWSVEAAFLELHPPETPGFTGLRGIRLSDMTQAFLPVLPSAPAAFHSPANAHPHQVGGTLPHPKN